MKKAKDIIVNILRESFPLIDEEKRDVVANRIVEELGVANVRVFDTEEFKERD